jgi:DNA-binding NtrC family response regulator
MNPQTPDRTSVVLVMASQDPALGDLRELLQELDVAVQLAASLQEFQQQIRRTRAEVVITGVSLPDGNWCDVLTSTVRADSAARVLICSREADERFWSEAIWRGVHDILVAPFTAEYLERAVDLHYGSQPCGPAEEDDPGVDRETEQRCDTVGADAMPIALPAVA